MLQPADATYFSLRAKEHLALCDKLAQQSCRTYYKQCQHGNGTNYAMLQPADATSGKRTFCLLFGGSALMTTFSSSPRELCACALETPGILLL
ncbi:unnamed protein product [Rhizophagus irregularis]|nr:unnamed protein product [Rhizophagus irregularis]CAB5376470.1 unnamed protein product [Rhizophagus irregularis]